jgi:hypothetical protein
MQALPVTILVRRSKYLTEHHLVIITDHFLVCRPPLQGIREPFQERPRQAGERQHPVMRCLNFHFILPNRLEQIGLCVECRRINPQVLARNRERFLAPMASLRGRSSTMALAGPGRMPMHSVTCSMNCAIG